MKWFQKKNPDNLTPDGSPLSGQVHRVESPHTTTDDLLQRIESAGLPANILGTARDEYERLAKVDKSSPEYAIGYNYLEFILSLPWNISTKDVLDLQRAEDVLNTRHYGLGPVKERILEFLAVKNLHSRFQTKILLVDDELIAKIGRAHV